jgi:type IV pilus assembly protein PilO
VASLTETRQRLMIAIGGLVLIDIIALVVLFSPLVGSEKDRLEELDQLRVQSRQKQMEVERVGDIDKKIVLASQQIDTFYKDRLSARDSSVSESLSKLASQSGVKLEQVKYTPADKDTVGLLPVEVEANLTGDYPQLARFLNSLERSQLFFIVDSVDLGGEQNNIVKLQMKLRTFVKTGA